MLSGTHTFVGFGFGPIQSGLFLYEAYQSRSFRRLVVAEINADLVNKIKTANGFYYLNIAHHDHIEQVKIGPIEIYNPTVPEDRESLIQAVCQASEIATAVPSINFYATQGDGSLHRVLAEGLLRKTQSSAVHAVIYAAENNNEAAEILEAMVLSCIPQQQHHHVRMLTQFVNTVIGKMSQVVSDADEIESRGLQKISIGYPHSFLVEAFNKIFISKINLKNGFKRGISAFIEKENSLVPFEEAKLFGHNAAHALLGYIAYELGLTLVRESLAYPSLMAFVRTAFIEESGWSLIRKYRGFDPLFTEDGFTDYVDDLLTRMTNPFLADSVDRVTRDVRRKLGWNDRLVGTMRMILKQGITPSRYALGAAVAVMQAEPGWTTENKEYLVYLEKIWQEDQPAEDEKTKIIALIHAAVEHVQHWRASGKKEIIDLVNFCG